ncbi:gamma-glutamyl-gamma-aminobutyrate hydrolase family protein [Frigoribacterium sp. 2-23]|uniref:gamma-glutamyl-gamma-aminobutyrate hydrolase family protein n=1 Tax=Frigoribacterium sp. 2-23 TaxID=3415006 RepID=UPI003C6FF360
MPDSRLLNTPRLLLVDVSDEARADAAYGASLRELSANVAATAADLGFEVRRVTADTAGPDGLEEALADCDAVLLTGGEDVDPELYGGEVDYPHREQVFTDADRAQIALVTSAVEARVPLIGICRGMQVVNVALGGDLVQHLHDGGHVREGQADSMLDHDVTLDAGSSLADVLGATSLSVRSSHHQAVDRPGDGLVVVARASDGTVEAVEHESAPLWAVQWHPEDSGSTGTVLRDLLTAARERAPR